MLIADDNEAEAEVLKRLLKRRFDAQVFIAKTMRETKSIIAANNLDCIVLDLQLPDSKIEESIKEVPDFPYPTFVYTGFDDPDLRERVLDAGAEDFIVKATGNASIIERIGHLQYKRSRDRKLLQGAYMARHDEPKRVARAAWRGTFPSIVSAIVAVLVFGSGLVTGGWTVASNRGRQSESNRQHFERLDEAIEALKQSNAKQDELLQNLQARATRSDEERNGMRDNIKLSNEHIIDWLKRIEDKISNPPAQRHTGR